jgi:hypothetical protein
MFRVYTGTCEIMVRAEKWEIEEDGKVVFYDELLTGHRVKAIFNLNNVLGFSEVE